MCDTGNAQIRSEVASLLHGSQFDFALLVDYLHDESRDSQVRWRAGAALAAFSYNSVANQRTIADRAGGAIWLAPPAGIRYDSFTSFLAPSQDDFIRCWAAYEV